MEAKGIATKGIGLLLVIAGAASAASPPSIDDAASKEVLAAMARTSTWGHPDEFGEFAGMQYYADGNYAKAMENFKLGARYADKLSQLSIGLMYLHGDGVERDPATAYAWLSLAAERNYPRYVATRDDLGKTLDADQRERAQATLAQLTAEYGDAVAKPRMARELRQGKSEMAGSFLGFGSSSVATLTVAQLAAGSAGLGFKLGAGPLPLCGAKSIDGAPIAGCSNLYVAWRWDAKEYFRIRDAVWTGTVRVGDPEKAGVPN